jgi:type I restriction enzyme S subunit
LDVKLRPYPAYKDSGLPWLGQVPEHWKVRRLKWAAALNPSKTEALTSLEANTPVTFLPMERVGADGRIDARETHAASAVWNGFTYFRRNDVLVAKITPCFENGKGACLDSLPTEIGFGSTEFHVLRARPSLSPQFLYRLTTVAEFRRLGADAMTGVAGQQRVPQAFIANYPIALPPLSEQTTIVRFHDYTDWRIRRYIHGKQRLIKLLEEQKQAIIHRAVTRGLDPDVRLKPSTIDWLREIPVSWSELTIRQISESLQTGPFGSQLHAHEYTPGGIPIINPSHLKNGAIIPDVDCAVDVVIADKLSRHRLEVGDIVFARRGELGRCGLVRKSEEGWICGTGSLRMRPKKGLFDPEYLLLVLSSRGIREFLSLRSVGATMENLNTSIIAQVCIPCPPLKDQSSISEHIFGVSAQIDHAISCAQREVELMREYCTRLIADVVTGKLDVCGVELPEVDEVEAREDWDEGVDAEPEEIADVEETVDADE